MTFCETHVELDVADRWFFPEFGTHVAYGQLFELYLKVEDRLQQAVSAEFEGLEQALAGGLSMAEALEDPRIEQTESTFLAGKLVVLNNVLVHFHSPEL